jgi:hypothetical protein
MWWRFNGGVGLTVASGKSVQFLQLEGVEGS